MKNEYSLMFAKGYIYSNSVIKVFAINFRLALDGKYSLNVKIRNKHV